MRLIDTRTIELRWFNDNDIPKYAILSHTWDSSEVTYQELVWINRAKALSTSSSEYLASSQTSFTSQDEQSALMLAAMEVMIRGNSGRSIGSIAEEDLMDQSGYSKIVHAAQQAQDLGYDFLWVDTCCIDKSSSAELQEAINSMYRWYGEADVCIIYLGDVAKPARGQFTTASEIAKEAFETCRWAKRGWTLQELVAPVYCRFYFQDWTLMGEKSEFLQELSDATGIPIYVLEDQRSVSEVSVAERMSWAANRETTRVEDMAYSLLGIFDIQMPLLYGEGEKAFIRLQEEILKTTDDCSLFAWSAITSDKATYRGLLARSPLEFRHCRTLERENVMSTFPITSTPIGLRVQLEFLTHHSNRQSVLALIRSNNSLNQRLAISLKCLDGGMQFARVDAGTIVPIDDWPNGQLKTIYVRQKLVIPPNFTTPDFRCFHIRRRIAHQRIPPVRILAAHPRELWDENSHELRIPQNVTEAFGALLLRVQSPTYAGSLNFPVAFGFNRSTCHYWVKAVPDLVAPADNPTRGSWADALKLRIPREVYSAMQENDVRHDLFIVGSSRLGINVSINAGLCGDNIALQVHIDGLMKWH